MVNTDKKGVEWYRKVANRVAGGKSGIELHLIHSRFRPADREPWVGKFLSRDTLGPDVNRILIATQVVEAGVDISAGWWITELAPWPSVGQGVGGAAAAAGERESGEAGAGAGGNRQ